VYSHEGELVARPPFDFRQSLRFLRSFAPAQGEVVLDDASLTMATSVAGRAIAFQVISVDSCAAPRLGYRLYSTRPIGSDVANAVADRISFFLSLEDDLAPFYELARQDPDFRPVVEELHGYHPVKFLTPFECGVWALLAQRTQMVVTRRMKQALAETYGDAASFAGKVYHAFPEAGRLALADPGELAGVIRHSLKAGLVCGAATAFDLADDHWLRRAPYAEVERWLRQTRGIGAWSAQFILLRGLGRTDKVPEGEVRVREAAGHIYAGGLPLNDEAFAGIIGTYGPWQGYWAHYLRAYQLA
jgi:DNA-3-methyladenine glycosylase II